MENKSAIGLSWDPKLPPISSGTKKSSEKALALQPGSVWIPETELADGLYVPPRDPRKLNKLMKKNATDTAGQSWFDMPAPTITRELKKDLEILKPPISSGTKKSSEKALALQPGSVWISETELVDGLYVPPRDPRKLNKLMKKNATDTAGQSWFDMPAPTITRELKKDLEILKLRNVIDPKKFFKKGEKTKDLPKYFQMGTVIEPASEFFSGRLTKKERKTSFADELLSDPTLKTYRKRKVGEIEEKNHPGGVEKWKNKGRQTWKRAKQRRG